MVDYYSNFIEIDLLTAMTSARVVTLLKKHCAPYSIPRMIVSFVENWGIAHVTSSPMHQRANGKAESAVKISSKQNSQERR